MVHGAADAAKADAADAGGSGGSIAWVGSADGEVVLVRHDISAREGSTGGRRSSSRVTGGSEENGAEPQPQMSAFGRAQSGGSTSNPGSSNLTHNLQVRPWHALCWQHQFIMHA